MKQIKYIFIVILIFELLPSQVVGQSESHWSGLPLYKRAFEKKGVKFPKPFGVGLASMYMTQDYRMTNMSIQGQKIDFFNINKATGTDLILMPRVDVWLLPFLNAYAFAGSISGQLDMNVTVQDPDVPIIQFDVPMNFEYSGFYYGIGSTITMASNNWFTMIDGNYSKAQLDSFDSKLSMLMLSARFGYMGKLNSKKMMVWMGTMYQNLEQTLEQIYDGEKVSVDVAALEPLNLLLGTRYEFNEQFAFVFEAGFIGRTQVIGHVEYRF